MESKKEIIKQYFESFCSYSEYYKDINAYAIPEHIKVQLLVKTNVPYPFKVHVSRNIFVASVNNNLLMLSDNNGVVISKIFYSDFNISTQIIEYGDKKLNELCLFNKNNEIEYLIRKTLIRKEMEDDEIE